jgi:hypothetical protein
MSNAMTEEQGNQIIKLLKGILSKLEDIQVGTDMVPEVNDELRRIGGILKDITKA